MKISKSPIQCSKGNLKCVLNCANFPVKKGMDICSRQRFHHLNTDKNNLVLVLTNKRGRINSHSQFLKTDSYPHQNN